MKHTSAITRAAVLSLAALALASAYARTYDFSEGKWNRNEFFEPRNAKWDRGSPVMQLPDCIMNACDPSWSDEELFKRHQIDVFSSLILTNRFRGDVTFSSRMSFDHRMAPSLVIAGECFTDSRGRKALGDFYEFVLYDEGINVWRHRGIKSGKPEVKKIAYTTHAFQKRTQYEFRAVVKRKRAHGGRMTTDIEVSAGGVSVGFHDDTVPDVFYIGVLGSEGRCRFYDFKVDDAALHAGVPFVRAALVDSRPLRARAPRERRRV